MRGQRIDQPAPIVIGQVGQRRAEGLEAAIPPGIDLAGDRGREREPGNPAVGAVHGTRNDVCLRQLADEGADGVRRDA